MASDECVWSLKTLMTVPLKAVLKAYSLGPCVVPAVGFCSCVVLGPDLGVVVPAPPVVDSSPVVVLPCSAVAAAV